MTTLPLKSPRDTVSSLFNDSIVKLGAVSPISTARTEALINAPTRKATIFPSNQPSPIRFFVLTSDVLIAKAPLALLPQMVTGCRHSIVNGYTQQTLQIS